MWVNLGGRGGQEGRRPTLGSQQHSEQQRRHPEPPHRNRHAPACGHRQPQGQEPPRRGATQDSPLKRPSSRRRPWCLHVACWPVQSSSMGLPSLGLSSPSSCSEEPMRLVRRFPGKKNTMAVRPGQPPTGPQAPPSHKRLTRCPSVPWNKQKPHNATVYDPEPRDRTLWRPGSRRPQRYSKTEQPWGPTEPPSHVHQRGHGAATGAYRTTLHTHQQEPRRDLQNQHHLTERDFSAEKCGCRAHCALQ